MKRLAALILLIASSVGSATDAADCGCAGKLRLRHERRRRNQRKKEETSRA